MLQTIQEIENTGIIYKHNKGGQKFQLINREISWLQFNGRVLQEAENPNVPLFERIKFLSIFSSNLDEFFRVRVAALRRLQNTGTKANLAKLYFHPTDVLNKIQQIVIKQQTQFEEIFNLQLVPALEVAGIDLLNDQNLTDEQNAYIKQYFKKEVLPYLTPIMISKIDKFPYLNDRAIYLYIKLYNKSNPTAPQYALLELPRKTNPRFVILPSSNNRHAIMLLDDVIRANLHFLFSMFEYDTIEAYTIKLTRDAELGLANDFAEPLLEKISKGLKRRKRGDPVRFIYDAQMPLDLLGFIVKRINLQKSNLIPGGKYHNFSDFMQFPDMGLLNLKYQVLPPNAVPFLDSHRLFFDAIKKRDIMLHHPYQSFDYVIRYIREAAIDPLVVSIRITLYRVAKISNIANSLVTAVMNGKDVTVFVEIQARFDEENNIYWGQKLEEAGAKVIYGQANRKVHCKMAVVSRLEKGSVMHYAHLSTGNYNGITARIYCDDALFTNDKRITTEAIRLFKMLENPETNPKFSHLLVAPEFMRARFVALIDQEIRLAKRGKKAYMILKMNSLVDPDMIAKLYEASKAGVKISLIIRGICCLLPGVTAMSENIKVISIIDRFLEHSRVFIFGNGGNEKYYLSSADWMPRNLINRIEVAFPIYNQELKKELRDMINIQLADNQKARIVDESMLNQFVKPVPKSDLIQAQTELYNYFKLKSGQGI